MKEEMKKVPYSEADNKTTIGTVNAPTCIKGKERSPVNLEVVNPYYCN